MEIFDLVIETIREFGVDPYQALLAAGGAAGVIGAKLGIQSSCWACRASWGLFRALAARYFKPAELDELEKKVLEALESGAWNEKGEVLYSKCGKVAACFDHGEILVTVNDNAVHYMLGKTAQAKIKALIRESRKRHEQMQTALEREVALASLTKRDDRQAQTDTEILKKMLGIPASNSKK